MNTTQANSNKQYGAEILMLPHTNQLYSAAPAPAAGDMRKEESSAIVKR